MSYGSRMVKKCACEKYPAASLEIRAPQLSCPMCPLWENARRRVRAAANLFPAMTGPGFADKPGGSARNIGWETADRLGARSIRIGAARAISAEGGCFAQLLKAGQWRSTVFRLYVDAGVEESKAMVSILMEASDDEGLARRVWPGE